MSRLRADRQYDGILLMIEMIVKSCKVHVAWIFTCYRARSEQERTVTKIIFIFAIAPQIQM